MIHSIGMMCFGGPWTNEFGSVDPTDIDLHWERYFPMESIHFGDQWPHMHADSRRL